MKNMILRSCASALVVAAGFLAVTFPAAGQSLLININQNNLAAVTFTTTGANSFAASTVYNSYGVDLISYFTSAPASGGAVTGSLIPPGPGNVSYNTWYPDNLNNGSSSVDLNLYVNTGSPVFQRFSTSSAALTGTGATINLSSLASKLPATGATGNIYSGNFLSPGVLIGTWAVVPEPPVEAQMALGALLVVGFGLFRRARNSASSR